MAQPQREGLRSSGLSLNFSSNNPFRNRVVSSFLQSSVSPFDDPPPRPLSRNPFLNPDLATHKTSSPILIPIFADDMETKDKSVTSTTVDLFDSLTLEDKKKSPPQDQAKLAAPRQPPAVRRAPSGPPGGPSGRPPGGPPGRRGPPPSHRPTRSQEEALRARKAQGGSSHGPVEKSPSRRMASRPRRNSESSALSTDRDKNLTDEEKKAREMRRRERERRHRENRDKKPVNRKLDIIDQLDATSIYGTGLFHHDGPFDALNPHRNKRRNAPMQAFPKDSLNNAIGGSGPLNKRADHSTLMGQHTDEAFKEWSTVPAEPKTGALFDPMARNSILHGDESMGLGTSTFLEGAPAARKDIQRHEEERAQDATDGLQRKKSLAQRIRSINRGPREYGSSGRMSNPDGTNGSGLRRSPTDIPSSNGGQAGNGDRNPFFNEFETGKGSEDKISVRRADAAEESPSPTRLERRATTDGTVDDVGRSAGGLLARVKSLKGGKRAVRPAPPNAVGESSVSPMAIPGAVI